LKPELSGLIKRAEKAEPSTRALFKKWKKKPPEKLDMKVQKLHEEVFEKYDCLTCANCCRTLGPKVTGRDIEKLSKFLKIRTSKFVLKYLKIDEDNDYVFQSMPCPFLGEDNYCIVYSERPKACSEYPHTDRRKFSQILDLTLKNTFTCPAVYEIVEKLKKI
jgi:hypothetical protein